MTELAERLALERNIFRFFDNKKIALDLMSANWNIDDLRIFCNTNNIGIIDEEDELQLLQEMTTTNFIL